MRAFVAVYSLAPETNPPTLQFWVHFYSEYSYTGSSSVDMVVL